MKLLICISVTSLLSICCTAQTDSLATSADSTKAKSTITFGTVYCTNADYYGQAANEKLSYLAAAVSYHHKSGLYLTGLAYRILSDTTNQIASAENISAGIEFNISKRLSADISYNHTFYPAGSPFLQAGNPDNASATLAYDAWVKPSISVDYAFGKTSDLFATAALGKTIALGSISKKDLLRIAPAISVVGGTQKYYQTYVTQKKLADSLLGIIFPTTPGQGTGNSSYTKTISSFNLLSYNFKMPLDYYRANYVVEASCQLSMPAKNAQAGSGKLNSFFSVSFYYQL
ncbi:MAG: hypothetical protein ABJB11_17945 [Ferruginibacter sp.]